MLDYLRALLATRSSERGASAVEYGLLVVGVALACALGFEACAFVLRMIFLNTQAAIEDNP
jgi:Flp pilus assembly pilin Flp